MIPSADYIIEELGLENIPEEQKAQITESIRSHMEDVIIDTTLDNLSPDQIENMKKELSKDDFDENTVMRISAGIPLLQEKIQTALNAEWDLIKISYHKIK